ncbi:hypothetical protein I4U23_004164 [Adineta vaga]|nr:hypothetical protein I4U23_004164 [Adineta vaga]
MASIALTTSAPQQTVNTFIYLLIHYYLKMAGRVTAQPIDMNNFGNTFSTLDTEHFIRMYQCNEGCCGPKSLVIVNDKRIIVRREEASICCCLGGAHIDSAIFMRDIQLLREYRGQSNESCFTTIVIIVTCTWPLLLFSQCCGDQAKMLEIKGGFGSELLKFKAEEMKIAADELSSIILPLKS